MTETNNNPAVVSAAALLTHYSFDLGDFTTAELMTQWQKEYQVNWLRLAVIEALYQGRYKAVSVAQILAFWKRRGEAIYHFNYEFERLICRNFPQEIFRESEKFAVEKEELEQPVVVREILPEVVEEGSLVSENKIEKNSKVESSSAIPPWQPVKLSWEKQKTEKVENNERIDISKDIEEVTRQVLQNAGVVSAEDIEEMKKDLWDE